MASHRDLLAPLDTFARRHHGDNAADTAAMLATLGHASLDALTAAAVPPQIRREPLTLPAALGESAALAELRAIAGENQIFRSVIGAGYYGTLVPGVIQRNILENPGWYTAYTPYQAEISQGRLEAVLNFQTLVTDLTGLEIANGSMLDEGTAAAEAMMMCHRLKEGAADAHRKFFVSAACHPQTIDIVKTRATPLGVEVVVGDHRTFAPTADCFGVLVQYPDTTGSIHDFEKFFAAAHAAGRSRSSPPTCWRSPCCGPRVNSAPTSPSARRSASACRSASADLTRGSSPPRTPSSARCPGGSSACRKTRRAIPRCASRSAHASSTSAATRPRRTSAPRRCSSP
jgi:glycine dehydrogenase